MPDRHISSFFAIDDLQRFAHLVDGVLLNSYQCVRKREQGVYDITFNENYTPGVTAHVYAGRSPLGARMMIDWSGAPDRDRLVWASKVIARLTRSVPLIRSIVDVRQGCRDINWELDLIPARAFDREGHVDLFVCSRRFKQPEVAAWAESQRIESDEFVYRAFSDEGVTVLNQFIAELK